MTDTTDDLRRARDAERRPDIQAAFEANEMLTAKQALAISALMDSMTGHRELPYMAEAICEAFGWPDADLSDAHLTPSGMIIFSVAEIARGT